MVVDDKVYDRFSNFSDLSIYISEEEVSGPSTYDHDCFRAYQGMEEIHIQY